MFDQRFVAMMYWLEESENILADDPIVQYVYICALKKTVHRIVSHIGEVMVCSAICWYDVLVGGK